MKKTLAFSLAASLLLPGLACANADIARANNCFGCHVPDRKLVGPAYQDVAKKYAGQKDAEGRLAAALKTGSKGVWGEVAMPPNPSLKDDDAKALAKWILGGAK